MSGAPVTRWQGILFGLAIGWLAAYCHFKLPLALPAMSAQFGYDRLLGGALMSVFAVAGLILSAAAGRGLSRGHGAALVAGALAAVVAGGVAGLAWPGTAALMLAARALEGAGYAVLAVAGAVIVSTNAAPRHQAMAMALYAAWMPAGQLAAVAVASPSDADWRALSAVGLAATGLLGLWTWRRARRGGFGAPAPAGAAAAGPASPERRRAVVAAALLFTLWSTQYMAYMTWLPSFLVEAHGLEIGAVVLAYAVAPAIVVVFNQIGGVALARGLRIGALLLPALVVQAATWLLVPVTGADWSGVLSLFAYGASTGLVTVCLFMLPGRLAGPGMDVARGFGVLMAGRNLGVLIGPLALAPALALGGGWTIVGPLFGAVTAAALILALWLMACIGKMRGGTPSTMRPSNG